MKQLLVIRHCNPEGENRLSEVGLKQVEKLKEKFASEFAPTQRFSFHSSKKGRTERTITPLAELVGQSLIDVEFHDFLFSDDRTDFERALREICDLLLSLESKADVVVLCTHDELAFALPNHYADVMLGRKIRKEKLTQGEAMLINTLDGSFSIWRQ